MRKWMRAGGWALAVVLFVLLVPGAAGAASADPSSVDFGDVPINTGVTQSVSITVDSGYRTELASGSGINAPFAFDFDTCGAGGGFAGPGTCTVKQSFHPTATGPFSGTTNVFECPIAGGSCVAIPYTVHGNGVLVTTTTTLTSSVNPSFLGQSVTFTATVAPTSGVTTPTGSVTFKDGASTLGVVPLSGGIATLASSALTVGSHTIKASYPGNATFTPSSATLTQVVSPTAKSLKQGALATANALLAGAGKSDADKLKEVVKKLTESLDPSNWGADDNHLQPKGGNEVFDKEKDAVDKLQELIRDKKSALPKATLQSIIDALVQADQLLATIAVNDAIAASGDSKKIAEAQKELGKAADELAQGNFKDAIEHYKNAWKKAQEAMKK